MEGLAAHGVQQRLAGGVRVALVTEARHGLVDQPELVRLGVEYCNAHSIPLFRPVWTSMCPQYESKCIYLRLKSLL
ncbi:hypothetical protein D9M70_569480 [compost metagenome]